MKKLNKDKFFIFNGNQKRPVKIFKVNKIGLILVMIFIASFSLILKRLLVKRLCGPFNQSEVLALETNFSDLWCINGSVLFRWNQFIDMITAKKTINIFYKS